MKDLIDEALYTLRAAGCDVSLCGDGDVVLIAAPADALIAFSLGIVRQHPREICERLRVEIEFYERQMTTATEP